VQALEVRHARDALLAKHAAHRVTTDLNELNSGFVSGAGRVRFTTIQARVKTKDSFFRKLFQTAREAAATIGVTPSSLEQLYADIRDTCGVRFACPYYDEILPAIQEVRSFLRVRGYATDLNASEPFRDKNYLDNGDDHGYRSYHFFIKIPTTTDIYGNVDLCLCEVQARSELQHIWAVKSHDLLYKPAEGWQLSDQHVTEDMRQVSNSLRAADQFLVSIRDRARGGSNVDRA
jgi:ppGpp synthetase/RelA/SpoT-type nucleotidyltranferase